MFEKLVTTCFSLVALFFFFFCAGRDDATSRQHLEVIETHPMCFLERFLKPWCFLPGFFSSTMPAASCTQKPGQSPGGCLGSAFAVYDLFSGAAFPRRAALMDARGCWFRNGPVAVMKAFYFFDFLDGIGV